MKIGKSCDYDFSLTGEKDAIHVPVVVVHSYDGLSPGQSVKFVDDRLTRVEICDRSERHGIVDPFLPENFNNSLRGDKPQMFLVLIEPSLVTKLTHDYVLNTDNIPSFEMLEQERCRGCY